MQANKVKLESSLKLEITIISNLLCGIFKWSSCELILTI